MKRILLLYSFFFTLFGHAQTGIQCDGIDDYIVVPSASNQIVSQDLSMAFWVRPSNANPGFPNFDGFAGFRNNSNADFYMLQLSASNVECRFRGSNGLNYDYVFTGLVLNAWNHFVMTHDGSTLTVYHNGILAGSVPAPSTITTSGVNFTIGRTDFQTTPFYTTGAFDDVALWNRAITAAEVATLYSSCSIDLNSLNLVLCYQFNEGVAGANNSSITQAIDSQGNLNGTYTGFAMTGTSSNFITRSESVSDSSTVTECFSYTTPGGQTYTQSGIYVDSLQTSTGCDSVITLDLTIKTVDTTISQNGTTLTANQAGGPLYQWINCGGGSVISTGQTYGATQNGDYACIVTYDGCQDTSECVTVQGIGLQGTSSPDWKIYPNPTRNRFILESNRKEELDIKIYDAVGRCTHQMNHVFFEERLSVDISGLPAGWYTVKIQSEHDETIQKLLVD